MTKVFPIILLIDVLLGMASSGDPRQKYTDRLAGVTVLETKHMYNMPPQPSAPYESYEKMDVEPGKNEPDQ